MNRVEFNKRPSPALFSCAWELALMTFIIRVRSHTDLALNTIKTKRQWKDHI